MKTFALLLLMSLSFVGYSQDYASFICRNESEVRRLSDNIALNAKRHFKFDTVKISHLDARKYIVSYSDIEDTVSNSKLNVVFEIYMKGANKDLEIIGTPEYCFSSVRGKYLDIFPFWKKFINPKADLQNVSEKKSDEITISLPSGKRNGFRFSDSDDLWKIRMIQY